ncbi:MAG: hypothetical protein ACRDSJ_15430 [Rubrobacteraceae bacterium]
MRKSIAMGALVLALAGCGQTDRVACADLDRMGDGVREAGIEREWVAEEIQGDLAEAKARANCEGYDAWWQSEDD